MNTNAIRHLLAVALLVLSAAEQSSPAGAQTRTVGIDPQTGIAAAVVIDDRPLAHTAQLLPWNNEGKIEQGIAAQTSQVVKNLEQALSQADTSTTHLARLNVYVTRPEDVKRVEKLLATGLLAEVHPAVTLVVSALPHPEALIAMDAIAAVPGDGTFASVKRIGSDDPANLYGMSQVAVMPRGRTVYISGMAARDEDLAESAAGTMEQLHGVLKLLGLDARHVVHVKAFLKPMDQVEAASAAMRRAFPDGAVPPMSFVQWSDGLPIEIEMIAHLPTTTEETTAVEHGWRPDERRSPVFCRFAVVNSPQRIYLSGVKARAAGDAAGEVRDVFDQVQRTLNATGSDLRHLVKATYYVTGGEVSQALGMVRTELYDPQHPPAASKATIAGTGDAERSIIVDLIAVPKAE